MNKKWYTNMILMNEYIFIHFFWYLKYIFIYLFERSRISRADVMIFKKITIGHGRSGFHYKIRK